MLESVCLFFLLVAASVKGADYDYDYISYMPEDVIDSDLKQFSEELFANDVNNAMRFLKIDYQGNISSGSTKDVAPFPLLRVNPKVYLIPTIAKFRKLFDNYIPDARIDEEITGEKLNEQNELLDAFLKTPVMNLAHKFLTKQGFISGGLGSFVRLLKEIWFTPYSRGGDALGSSGFEHVFIGEIKKRKVSGFHNWIYFSDQEQKGAVNYLGLLKKLDLLQKGAITKMKFFFNGHLKPIGGMFIGTSPEFEMALYTVCFIMKPNEDCNVQLQGQNVKIKTFTKKFHNKKLVASAYAAL